MDQLDPTRERPGRDRAGSPVPAPGRQHPGAGRGGDPVRGGRDRPGGGRPPTASSPSFTPSASDAVLPVRPPDRPLPGLAGLAGYRLAWSMPNGRCPPTQMSANPALSSLPAKTRSAIAPATHPAQALWSLATSGGARPPRSGRPCRSGPRAAVPGRSRPGPGSCGPTGSAPRWRWPRPPTPPAGGCPPSPLGETRCSPRPRPERRGGGRARTSSRTSRPMA